MLSTYRGSVFKVNHIFRGPYKEVVLNYVQLCLTKNLMYFSFFRIWFNIFVKVGLQRSLKVHPINMLKAWYLIHHENLLAAQ